jgi:hypothetical protein
MHFLTRHQLSIMIPTNGKKSLREGNSFWLLMIIEMSFDIWGALMLKNYTGVVDHTCGKQKHELSWPYLQTAWGYLRKRWVFKIKNILLLLDKCDVLPQNCLRNEKASLLSSKGISFFQSFNHELIWSLVFSEYFGFPCHPFHQILHPHNHLGQVQ